MGPPPDFQLKFGEHHGLIDIEPQDPNIRNLGESASSIDRIGCERVMVAGENDDGTAVVAHHLSGALQQFEGLAVIVECVPRQQDNVGPYLSCRSQNLGKHCQRIGVAEAVIYPKVQIRAVNDNRFWVRTHDQLIPEQVSFKLTNVDEKRKQSEGTEKGRWERPFSRSFGRESAR